MSTLAEHKAYLNKGKFEVHYGHALFNLDEIHQLEKYGHWLRALAVGELEPITKEQSLFVAAMDAGKMPEGDLPKLWFKYAWRREEERKHPDKYNLNYHIKEEGFYTRTDYKKMKRMMMSEMGKNHNK